MINTAVIDSQTTYIQKYYDKATAQEDRFYPVNNERSQRNGDIYDTSDLSQLQQDKKQLSFIEETIPLNTPQIEQREKQFAETVSTISNTVKAPHSKQYLQHKNKSFVLRLIELLNVWKKEGSEGSLFEIAEFRELISGNKAYFTELPEYRIFLSTIDLLFTNNNWEKVTSTQINQLIEMFNAFKNDGQVTLKSLKSFSRSLFKSNLQILKDE